MDQASNTPSVTPQPESAEAVGHALTQSAHRLRALRENADAVLDPLGMLAPIVHAHTAWMLHPQELAELWSRFAGELLALQLHTASKLLGRNTADLVQPHGDDLRFTDPVWTSEVPWDLLKQWYLFFTRNCSPPRRFRAEERCA